MRKKKQPEHKIYIYNIYNDKEIILDRSNNYSYSFIKNEVFEIFICPRYPISICNLTDFSLSPLNPADPGFNIIINIFGNFRVLMTDKDCHSLIKRFSQFTKSLKLDILNFFGKEEIKEFLDMQAVEYDIKEIKQDIWERRN